MIKKIEIPKPRDKDKFVHQVVLMYEEWDNLVYNIQRNNEAIDGMTRVYYREDPTADPGTGGQLGQTAFSKYYAYITKPLPLTPKTKEEKALEFVEEIRNERYGFSFRHLKSKAKAILEES